MVYQASLVIDHLATLLFQLSQIFCNSNGVMSTLQARGVSMTVRYCSRLCLQVLAGKLAAIEGTQDAIVVASGMAAIHSAMTALLRPGDHFLTQAFSLHT